ncbi:hypothetical protein GUITHDRAFT_152575 [Guillardia theta CCMP2712]|uniref:Uncharacterized protein n=1 Tax=Guillardia theta (strain CCMP2712) TaxID=905079 RepID=L1JBC0_GUITC|nr:hypothetical protein GUITHDRAFT_152575 [Guillardia theta CCMP2712]EKX45828.1 hypothetical protein GUITHDRAFT_152575 [Guillardia theta CCMP2712]|eukprot:XP_005832808.1 hypothetical protein GUITHDRAFT_152575 [Guillardia theta CCMP2712]
MSTCTEMGRVTDDCRVFHGNKFDSDSLLPCISKGKQRNCTESFETKIRCNVTLRLISKSQRRNKIILLF